MSIRLSTSKPGSPTLACALALACLWACNNAEFSAPESKKEKPAAGAQDRSDTDLDVGANDSGESRDTDTDTDANGNDNGDQDLEIDGDGLLVERFQAAESLTEVDIAFIIDTSGSMDNEIIEVQNRLAGLITRLTDDAKTKNFQIFIMAGADDNQFIPPAAVNNHDNVGFLGTNHKVGSHNALGVAKAFLDRLLIVPGLSLRDKSSKDIIFITDDDAESSGSNPEGLDEGEFRAFLSGLGADQDLHFHGIVCPDSGGDCADRGDVYYNLANDPQWQGTTLDLRLPNWDPVFEELAKTISARLDYVFKLSEEVKDAKALKVELNGDPVDDDEFTYDSRANTLTFSGQDLEPGDTVIVRY